MTKRIRKKTRGDGRRGARRARELRRWARVHNHRTPKRRASTAWKLYATRVP